MTAPPTRPLAETSWPAFVETYGRAILQWFRDSGLPAEVIGRMLPQLLRSLRGDFAHLPGEFRPWLQRAGASAWNQLEFEPTRRDQFLQALDAECWHQRRRDVLPRVQARANARDWEMFYGVVLGEIPEAEVAAHTQTSPRLVRTAVFRIYRLLEDELQCLEELF